MKNQVSQGIRRPRVNPLPDLQAINRIRVLIRSNIRDLLLFELALETGSPANKLLQLKIRDLQGLNVGDKMAALGVTSKKDRQVTMGLKTHETFQRYLKDLKPDTKDFLFKSRKGNGPLSISSASRIASRWFKKAGLNNMSGLLSLRKTWEVNQKRSLRKQQAMKPAKNTEPTYTANSIRTKTAQELVYKELEQAIIKGQLKPGEKLVTEKLARQMGTSRIPVREAMGRLEARNFIKVQPKKGVTVSELSESNLKEILEIRLMLEPAAAMKAASSSSEETLQRLERFNSQYVAAQTENDADEALRANKEFHFTIYREARMPILLSMIQNLWNQVSPYYHIMFRQTMFHDPHTGNTYHKKMIEGMAAKNPHKVGKWLKTDLVDSTKFVISVMRSMQVKKKKTIIPTAH